MEQKVVNLESVLKNNNMQELDLNESIEVDGGVLPALAGVGAGFLKVAGYVGAGATIVGAGYAVGRWVGRHF
ncbi:MULTISPECIES: class IIb bacteriocin, lactobin A/cerein 7B family [Bacillaceae]|jgi:hypothetical protein|uniref:class IIb bacteriocin, lactobin A/cerein 7B family n=1 Tax=Bacillales TaxID=1385 RepID=UPI0011A32E17|nr:class IIb bacteriocin, lactobin A/cerein 7B family [Geobacillus sp. C56-T2]NNV06480.1 class IIb bacteriocin, lactobin A/cerein 7B family [Geobacillus sp. MMMUD3]TWG29340.1 hypothetical protein GC56T2_0378 [Geobacillus sp. C56-T2]